MITLLMMIIAFFVLLGVALLYLNILKMNIGESFVLSVVTLIAILYITGIKQQDLMLGRNIFCGLASFGFVFTVVQIVRKKFVREKLESGFLPLLFLIMIINIILFRGDYIHFVDELHFWALVPKQMLRSNQIPPLGAGQNIGTCMFQFFFLTFSGYNEGMMYVTATLLSWIGFLLPVSNVRLKENWLNILLYTGIITVAMPTIYLYNLKNMYVDVPTAAWIGGLAGWSLSREKKWQNVILIGAVMWVAYPFKDNVGLALDFFFLILFFIIKMFMEKETDQVFTERRVVLGAAGVMVLAVVGFVVSIYCLEKFDLMTVLPESLKSQLLTTYYSLFRVERIVNKCLSIAFGSPLGVFKYKMVFSYVSMVVLCIIMVFIQGYKDSVCKESALLMAYIVLISILYLLFTICIYVFTFTTFHANRVWSCGRYLSICGIYLFVLCLSLILVSSINREGGQRYIKITGLLCLLFFVFGLRTNALNFYTTFYDRNNIDEFKIREQKEQAIRIQEITKGEGRVFFLNQKYKKTEDFGINPALYYLDGQISDILTTPSQYNESGALVRHYYYSSIKIEGFPQVLTDGGYTYVWLYKTNQYLNQKLPVIMKVSGKTELSDNITGAESGVSGTIIDKDNPANLMDGQLYEVIYNNEGIVTGLKLVENLVLYDNLAEHISE